MRGQRPDISTYKGLDGNNSAYSVVMAAVAQMRCQVGDEEMKKMIFLNVGRMKNYRGLNNDEITGGGAFVWKSGYGLEVFNFQPFNEYMYGYVQVKGSINIERLGASRRDGSIDDVLVIWVANSPSGGTVIVGWYNNATVYRRCQPAPSGSARECKGEECGYHVKAKQEDCRLLPIDSRVFKIPRQTKGGMGQSNVWYADQKANESFRQEVLSFIRTGKIQRRKHPAKRNGRRWQPDPYKRQKVEKSALALVTKHYEDLGYDVDSVEEDNVGWDLEASLLDKLLRLEVKGLSQKEVLIELTPNEYRKMKRYKDSYRICVVTDALSRDPLLRIFAFSPESAKWEDDEGTHLMVNEIVGARMKMSQPSAGSQVTDKSVTC